MRFRLRRDDDDVQDDAARTMVSVTSAGEARGDGEVQTETRRSPAKLGRDRDDAVLCEKKGEKGLSRCAWTWGTRGDQKVAESLTG